MRVGAYLGALRAYSRVRGVSCGAESGDLCAENISQFKLITFIDITLCTYRSGLVTLYLEVGTIPSRSRRAILTCTGLGTLVPRGQAGRQRPFRISV